MCIIAVKPIGEELMERRILENCFNYNSDGMGFMWNEDGEVHISKGYMNFEEGYRVLKELDRRINLKERGLVIHFRIATSGNVDMGACHPFAISNSDKTLRTLELTTDIGVAHNGIISAYIPPKNSILSDTQLFIKDYLYNIKEEIPNFLTNSNILFAIEKVVGSKLAFLDGEGNVTTVGKFIEEDNYLFSNETYLDLTDLYKSWNTSYYYNDSPLDDEYDLSGECDRPLELDTFLDVMDCLFIYDSGIELELDNGRTIICNDGIIGSDCVGFVYEIDYTTYSIHKLGGLKYDEYSNYSVAFGNDDSTVEYPF